MNKTCYCVAIGKAVQTFRIRNASRLFEVLVDLGSDHANFLDARAVWACRWCGELFAWIRIPEKGDEELLVRPDSRELSMWNWVELAERGSSCRWRGPDVDERYVI